MLRDPFRIGHTDFLCVESTYGDRSHRAMALTEEELAGVLRKTLVEKRGNVIIPAFAVGRTQEVPFVLADLARQGRVERLEVVVDSPMASAVTELTLKDARLWDAETRALLEWARAHPEKFEVRFVQDVEESIALNDRRSGLLIISASGMCDAGRIKYHLRQNLGRKECSIVICGLQAAGTLGRRLVDGASAVTLFGERVPVRADIHTIGGFSAHADQLVLIEWLSPLDAPPTRIFVVHGEPGASLALADAIGSRLHWPRVTIPEQGKPYRIDSKSALPAMIHDVR